MSTLIIVAVVLGLYLMYYLVWSLLLKLGTKWARIPISIHRALFIGAIVFAIGIPIAVSRYVVIWYLEGIHPIYALVAAVLGMAIGISVEVSIVRFLLKSTIVQIVKAWVPCLIAGPLMLGIAFFLVRPFVMESYSVPTGAMSPTIVGNHIRATCPNCNSTGYGSPLTIDEIRKENWFICSKDFHLFKSSEWSGNVQPGDRVITNKLLKPKRWDVITFQYPEEPRTTYVMRLVGLPGETIAIRNGKVEINGETLELPSHLKGLNYEMNFEEFWPYGSNPIHGNTPIELGPDENFVLGDFSILSKDSRLWTVGAPGHAPYAVPSDYIEGVVTHIYQNRWKILR